MRPLITTIACLSMLCLSLSCVAHRTCSSEVMVKLIEGGFSVEDIDRACMSYEISDEMIQTAGEIIREELDRRYQNGNQPAADGDRTWYQPAVPRGAASPQGAASVTATSAATTCSTQYGVCPLMQPGVSGAPCVCQSWYGQFPGVMR
jgi:hypothetical protein